MTSTVLSGTLNLTQTKPMLVCLCFIMLETLFQVIQSPVAHNS